MSDLPKELSEIDQLGVQGSDQSSLETKSVQSIDRKLKMWLKSMHKSSKMGSEQSQQPQPTVSQNPVKAIN